MWPEVDRREEPRVEVAVPVEVGGEPPIAGTSCDLSTEGMRVELERSLPVASEIAVAFELPGGGERVSATAEVRWCKQVGRKSADKWIVGVSFATMEEDDRERLSAWLEDRGAGE